MDRFPTEVEMWLKSIAFDHVNLPTAEAVDAILSAMESDQNHQNYVATVGDVFVRGGLLRWYQNFLKREQVAVISYSGSVLSVPARYGRLVPRDPANPSNGKAHQLAMWADYSIRELDDLIIQLGGKAAVLEERAAFFANLRRRWAEECPQLATAGAACQYLGLEVIP